jgi:hypothetical protein
MLSLLAIGLLSSTKTSNSIYYSSIICARSIKTNIGRYITSAYTQRLVKTDKIHSQMSHHFDAPAHNTHRFFYSPLPLAQQNDQRVSWASNPYLGTHTSHIEDLFEPPVKRAKVRQACITCRFHKRKCDGEDPCFYCERFCLSCEYAPRPKTWYVALLSFLY